MKKRKRRVRARLEQLERLVFPAKAEGRAGLRRRRKELSAKCLSGTLAKLEEVEKAELDALFSQEDQELNRRHDLTQMKFEADRRWGTPLTDDELCELGSLNRRYRGFDVVIWAAFGRDADWPTSEEAAAISRAEEVKYEGRPPPEVEVVEPPELDSGDRIGNGIDWVAFDRFRPMPSASGQ